MIAGESVGSSRAKAWGNFIHRVGLRVREGLVARPDPDTETAPANLCDDAKSWGRAGRDETVIPQDARANNRRRTPTGGGWWPA